MRSSPAAVASVALIALVLAGCLSTAPGPGSPGTTPPSAGDLAGLVRVTTRNGPASEVSLAINPTNPLNLVGGAKDFTLGADPGPGCDQYNVWSGVYWTHDGGATWGNALMPGYPGDPNTTLLSHYTCNSDPVLAFGTDGAAYYSGLAYGGAGTGAAPGTCPGDQATPVCGGSVWIAKSTDGGATWEQFVPVIVSDESQVSLDKQWFDTDPTNPQNLVMTWIQFSGPAAYFMIAASSDGAASWTPPITLAEIAGPFHQFAMPQYGPDGTVYVVWNNFGGGGVLPLPLPDTPLGDPGASQVMFTKNLPGTPAFQPARPVATIRNIASPVANSEVRAESMPILAVARAGPNAGHLYIAWADDHEGQDDILMVTSSDGGNTWSAPVKVNQDTSQTDQFMTWVTTDEEGGVDVLFMDRSYDPANTQFDATIARSMDDGQTWTQVRVTPRSWGVPEGCYHQRGFPFIGDYVGLVAGNGTLTAFFPAGYSGRCDVYAAAIPYTAFGGNTTMPAHHAEGAPRLALR